MGLVIGLAPKPKGRRIPKMSRIAKRFNVGDRVKLSPVGLENENYEKFSEVELVVSSVATKYMKAAEFYANGQPHGYHPGFDQGAGAALYDLETVTGTPLPFSLYDWELTAN
jgi:hypothetical protein